MIHKSQLARELTLVIYSQLAAVPFLPRDHLTNYTQCTYATIVAYLANISIQSSVFSRGYRTIYTGVRFFFRELRIVAGCGKSTIAQTFAEMSAAHGRLGASFFCSRDFPDRRNLRLIIPTLARGLALRFPEFKTALVRIIRSYLDVADDSLAVQFEKLIVEPLKSTGLSIAIVVGALNELKGKKSSFLSVLDTYIGGIPNVKFFITGRPEDHIRSGFAIASLRTKELPLYRTGLFIPQQRFSE